MSPFMKACIATFCMGVFAGIIGMILKHYETKKRNKRKRDPGFELAEKLKDRDYRRGFVEGHAKDTVAFQLRAMRKAREWDQNKVAAQLGDPKLQPMISRYENPDYGKFSIATLLKLAEAFDVGLIVRFAPFSELIEWDISDQNMLVKSFEDEFGTR